jgi:hypothetical protein
MPQTLTLASTLISRPEPGQVHIAPFGGVIVGRPSNIGRSWTVKTLQLNPGTCTLQKDQFYMMSCVG